MRDILPEEIICQSGWEVQGRICLKAHLQLNSVTAVRTLTNATALSMLGWSWQDSEPNLPLHGEELGTKTTKVRLWNSETQQTAAARKTSRGLEIWGESQLCVNSQCDNVPQIQVSVLWSRMTVQRRIKQRWRVQQLHTPETPHKAMRTGCAINTDWYRYRFPLEMFFTPGQSLQRWPTHLASAYSANCVRLGRWQAYLHIPDACMTARHSKRHDS